MTRLGNLMERRARKQRELAFLDAQIAQETTRISDAGGWRVRLRPEQALAVVEGSAAA